MAQLRAQVVLQGRSGLPRDQYVNVFHFVTPTANVEQDSAAVATALVARYQALSFYLSEYVSLGAEVKVYSMADPTPRQPRTYPLTLQIPTDQVSLPHEVAVCLSFNGGPPNTARRRGRIYFGPLNAACMDVATFTSPPRPHQGMINGLRDFGVALEAANLGWSVFSPTTQAYVPVTNGWVDNEFDTMRSRGNKALVRAIW